MIIFLYGLDDYRRNEKKRSIIAEFKKKHSNLGIEQFNAEEEGALLKLEAFLRGQSIFESHKLAILEDWLEEAEKNFKKILETYRGDKSSTLLIVERGKPQKAFSFLLEKPVVAQEFAVLKDHECEFFIRSEGRARGLEFAPDAIGFLTRACAGDSFRAVTELDKLVGLGKKEIAIRDLEKLDVETKPDYWLMMQGLKSKDFGKRLHALEQLFSQNEPAAKIFNIISAMWPEKISAFAAYDLAVKSGKCDYEEALLDAVLS